MFSKKIHIIILCMLLLSAGRCFSQIGFYVPSSGKVFFTGDSSSIFSDVINNGTLGLGKNAVLNFSGQTWRNDLQSKLTDESNNGTGINGIGGWVRFLSSTTRQQLIGGYNAATISGPSFSRIKIDNSKGVELSESSAKFRKEVAFINGSVYLKDQILIVGNNDPGTITGYDSAHYFVTGNNPNTGLLLRERIRKQDGQVVFPVGSKDGAYTPAAIQNRSSQPDDYYVSVFDSVRTNATSGMALVTSSVNKTWQVGKRWNPGLDKAEVTLQHLLSDEGAAFAQQRQFAFVSQYKNDSWDKGNPRSTPLPGYLSTTGIQNSAGSNSRLFAMPGNSYFTKMAEEEIKVLDKTKLWFNAYRQDAQNVYVYWRTNPEVNIQKFIVQRRLSNEANFKSVDTVASKAANGYSNVLLSYATTDPNNYKGISFYRLELIRYDSASSYSDTVAVGPQNGLYSILLWPNPTPDIFYISVHKTLPLKSIIIWNVLGQKIREEKANGRTRFEMGGLIPGTYFVSFVLTTDVVIETKKLIVTGY